MTEVVVALEITEVVETLEIIGVVETTLETIGVAPTQEVDLLAVTNDSNAEDTVVVPVSGQYVVQLVVSEVMTVTPVVTSVLLHKLSEHEVTVITVVDWSKVVYTEPDDVSLAEVECSKVVFGADDFGVVTTEDHSEVVTGTDDFVVAVKTEDSTPDDPEVVASDVD